MAAHGRSAVAAILVAAGVGERLGAAVPKAFVEVRGRALLSYAIETFRAHAQIIELVVVAPPTHLEAAANLCGVAVVAGGATRQESVAHGLAALTSDVEYVLVHDVARPFVPASVIDAVISALVDGADAAIPVVPIADTVRRVQPDGELAGVVDRSALVAVQTPQGFRRDVLVNAHGQVGAAPVTDDAALAEALGYRVVAVPGAESAFKITTPQDLARAESVAAQPSPPGGTP
jgi:2-C-methyl-D-erythritol 4-phosphate cytidylyltransferase